MLQRGQPHLSQVVADLAPEKQHDLIVEAELELSRRTVTAALMYLPLFLTIALTDTQLRSHWPVSVGLAAVFLALSIVRVRQAHAMLKQYKEAPQVWSRHFRAGVYASAALWSAFSCISIGMEPGEREVFLILLVTAGLASGGMVSLAPDLTLSRRYQFILLLPSAVVLLFQGNQGWGVAVAVCLYLTFHYLEAEQLCNSYWLVLKTNALLLAQSQELKKAKDAAETATRLKGEFLDNVSHELRTPLNGILGMSRMALETDLNEEQRGYITDVIGCGESLLAIVNDILDFSQLAAKDLSLHITDFNFKDLVEQTVSPFNSKAHAKGLQFSFSVDAAVPEILIGDASRLRQLLNQIVSNAVKFTNAGEVRVQIEVHSDSETHVVLHVGVSDTGIGIAVQNHAFIFEAFSQADSSTTRSYGGTGLGLALSARLVEVLGGRIWFESEEGKGSVFHFTVKLKKDRRKLRRSEPEQAAAASD